MNKNDVFDAWVSRTQGRLGASDFVAAAIEVNDTMEVAKKILQQTLPGSHPATGLIIEVTRMILERERVKHADRQPVDK